MDIEKFRIIQDPVYGYRRLEPVPDEKEIAEFYKRQYYESIRTGDSQDTLRRSITGGKDAERERAWLSATLYSDIRNVLNQYASNRTVLDVGCGPGELLSFLQNEGFETVGIEPSVDAAAIARDRGLNVFTSTLEEFVEHHRSKGLPAFAAITLMGVLEHVPNPAGIIELTKEMLEPQVGILCVQVPNDFSELQSAARQKLNKEPWWVAIPDHINYFDFQSLRAMLEHFRFEIIDSQGDFPMELFLLMGDDYVGNPEVGSRCHQKRVRFEMAIPGELRRRIYRALAEIGVGRDILIIGRLDSPPLGCC